MERVDGSVSVPLPSPSFLLSSVSCHAQLETRISPPPPENEEIGTRNSGVSQASPLHLLSPLFPPLFF